MRWVCRAARRCGRHGDPARLRASPADDPRAVALQARSLVPAHTRAHTHTCFLTWSPCLPSIVQWPHGQPVHAVAPRERCRMAEINQDKLKALETAVGQIERQFGKGAIMRLGQQDAVTVNVIPTGSLGLDAALGVGGFPRGRVIEIYGPESSGKTTLALHVIANAQATGGARGVHRRRARPRPGVLRQARRRSSTTCWSRSRTTASRRSRSPRRWSAPARSTSSSSTRWRRWCRAPSSRARWATRRWACRRG